MPLLLWLLPSFSHFLQIRFVLQGRKALERSKPSGYIKHLAALYAEVGDRRFTLVLFRTKFSVKAFHRYSFLVGGAYGLGRSFMYGDYHNDLNYFRNPERPW